MMGAGDVARPLRCERPVETLLQRFVDRRHAGEAGIAFGSRAGFFDRPGLCLTNRIARRAEEGHHGEGEPSSETLY